MSKPDFSNIAALAVGETERDYVFDLIPGRPSVFFNPASNDNPTYRLESNRRYARRANEAGKRPRAKGPIQLTAEQLMADEDQDTEDARELIALCATRWGVAPRAADGTEPKFSPENALAFVKALPPFMFLALRRWCENVLNFVDTSALTEDEAKDLGNS